MKRLFLFLSLVFIAPLYSQPTDTRPTVVFDIDECIAWKIKPEDLDAVKTYFPECRFITVNVCGQDRPHMFAPYSAQMFLYLLDKGFRIAFFSSGDQERNEPLMEAYFREVLGDDAYEQRKAEGQFQVFSKHHLKTEFNASSLKDLSIVGGLENTILVDDDYSYVPKGQAPCLKGKYDTRPYQLDAAKKMGDKRFLFRSKKDCCSLALNHTYYFLGVLRLCQRFMKDDGVSLRHALASILEVTPPPGAEIAQKGSHTGHYIRGYAGMTFRKFPGFDHLFTRVLINRGLEFIRKKVPSAQLYTEEDYGS